MVGKKSGWIQFKCWKLVEIFPHQCFEINLHNTEWCLWIIPQKNGPLQRESLQVVVTAHCSIIRRGHGGCKPTTERFFFSSTEAKHLYKKSRIGPSQHIIHEIRQEVFYILISIATCQTTDSFLLTSPLSYYFFTRIWKQHPENVPCFGIWSFKIVI